MNVDNLQQRVVEIQNQLQSLPLDKQAPLINELLEIVSQLEQSLSETINKLDKEDE